MPNPRSKPRATDMLSAMIDGYVPAIEKSLEGVNSRAADVKTLELRELLAVWEELRSHLASGNGI